MDFRYDENGQLIEEEDDKKAKPKKVQVCKV